MKEYLLYTEKDLQIFRICHKLKKGVVNQANQYPQSIIFKKDDGVKESQEQNLGETIKRNKVGLIFKYDSELDNANTKKKTDEDNEQNHAASRQKRKISESNIEEEKEFDFSDKMKKSLHFPSSESPKEYNNKKIRLGPRLRKEDLQYRIYKDLMHKKLPERIKRGNYIYKIDFQS